MSRTVGAVVVTILALGAAVPAGAHGGHLLWEDRFDPSRTWDQPYGVASGHGMVVVVGESQIGDNIDILVRAYDQATGELAWEDRIDPAGGWDTLYSVVVGGRIAVVAGNIQQPDGNVDWFVRAYELSSGAPIWEDILDKAGCWDSAETLALDGNLVVATGYGNAGCGGTDWVTRAYDVRSGKVLWTDQFDTGGQAQGIGVAVTGNVVVVGGSNTPADLESSSALVRAYDARSGKLLWQDQATGPGAFINFITQVVASDDRVFAVGIHNDDWLVRAYHARTGRILWQRSYRLVKGHPEAPDAAFHVATDGDQVIVAGYGSHDATFFSRDWVVNTYDARTGRLRWSDVLNPSDAFDEAVGGVVIHRGQAFVSGEVFNAAGFQTTLIRAYDLRSGDVLWEDEGPAHFPPGVWRKGLTASRGQVTTVGWAATGWDEFGSYNALDTIVRSYDASHPHVDR